MQLQQNGAQDKSYAPKVSRKSYVHQEGDAPSAVAKNEGRRVTNRQIELTVSNEALGAEVAWILIYGSVVHTGPMHSFSL